MLDCFPCALINSQGLRNAVRIELEIQYKKGSQQMSQITPTTYVLPVYWLLATLSMLAFENSIS